MDSRGGYFSKILYVEMKESGPVGGACAGHAPLDPPMIKVVTCSPASGVVKQRQKKKLLSSASGLS